MKIFGTEYIVKISPSGYYYPGVEKERELVYRIVLKFNITNWNKFLSAFKFYYFSTYLNIFPEFKYLKDLKRFEILINSNLLINICDY